MSLLLGCIADDLTGATDIALMLAKHGMNVSLLPTVPESLENVHADAVVIALKTRTCPVNEAVTASIAAVKLMLTQNVQQVYFKYCSTFDSTSEGNIGPVTEALMDLLNTKVTVVVPSFPKNARTVYQAYLFVGNTLLSESSMRDHPLTPMRDSNLLRVLTPQVERDTTVMHIPHWVVAQGCAAIQQHLSNVAAKTIAVVDTLQDEDLFQIGAACANLPFLTGASGLAMGLPQNFLAAGQLHANHGTVTLPLTDGPMVILAGSCSQATRAQIKAIPGDFSSIRLDVDALLRGDLRISGLLHSIESHLDKPAILIYSSANPEVVAQLQKQFGRDRVGDTIERTLGDIARQLTKRGVRKFVVAGGETSGAVSQALKLEALAVGPEIAPGVPWMVSDSADPMVFAFKSGNFGGEHFFNDALRVLP